jgi:hypothetical protein
VRVRLPIPALIIVAGFVGALPAAALAHGGDEAGVEALSNQPARILAQQALAELQIRNDSEEAAMRLDAAVESEDTSDVDLTLLERAMKTVDEGDPQAAIPLLDRALSEPLGESSGSALHEAGREFQPGTGTQEVIAIILGALLLLAGAVSLYTSRARETGVEALR